MEVQRNPKKSPNLRDKPRSRGSRMGGDDYRDMILPGQDFMKDIISRKKPTQPGLYLIFYKYDPPSAWDNVENQTGRAVGMMDNGEWWDIRTVGCTVANFAEDKFAIGANVLGYIGPLPCLNLAGMIDYTPGYPINQTFYVSTLEQAKRKKYSSGPHALYFIATLRNGFRGEYIFLYNSENNEPIPIAWWNPKSEAATGWTMLEDDEKEKAIKKMGEI